MTAQELVKALGQLLLREEVVVVVVALMLPSLEEEGLPLEPHLCHQLKACNPQLILSHPWTQPSSR
jgi:hypothetical protein